MKFISDRVSVSETADGTSIIISPDYNKTGQNLLLAWVILWTLGGLLMVSQLFGEYSREEKLYLFVWSVFWLYFEYVGVYAWLWKKYGFEKISIGKEVVLYYRSLMAKGKPQLLHKSNISEVSKTIVPEKSFWSGLSNSYWNIGNESCEFRYNGKAFRFGLKLNQGEAEGLVRYLRKKVSG